MFNADNVVVGSGSKYQSAGISNSVVVSEVLLLDNSNGTQSIQLKTVNENDQAGLSKRLSINTVPAAGKTFCGWDITAGYLKRLIMSATGKTEAEANEPLRAANAEELVKNLRNTLIGKPFRGLFSSREYQPGKFAIELYKSEPLGGTYLIYDPTNKDHNFRLPVEDKGDLPF